MDKLNYPPEIIEYLQQETRLIAKIIERYGYNYFLEIGCMDVRCQPIATLLGIHYYGVDIVDKFIVEANEKIKQAKQDNPSMIAEAHLVSIYDLPSCLNDYPLQPDTASVAAPLMVFPFNSFGNIDNPEKATQVLRGSDMDFLILTYTTDDDSTLARSRYYQNCGYTGITATTDDKGVRFTSLEGLDSVAYRESYIRGLCENSFLIAVYPFAQIGIAYHGIKDRQNM